MTKHPFTVAEESGIVPVVAVPSAEAAVPLAEALERGGLPLIEVTFRNEFAVGAIAAIKRNRPGMTVGAGTILTTAMADAALDAGADFLVSPGLNPEVAEYALKRNAPILPGCVTPSEIEAGRKLGLCVFKFFPSELNGGVRAIRELCGPYRDIAFVPTSGITLQNLPEYLACPHVAAVGGSFMAPAPMVKAGDWDGIAARCREALRAGLNFRLLHVGLSGGAEEGRARAERMAEIFGMPYRQGGKSDFAGDFFESGKIPFPGEKGHIAVGTPSLERAMAQLAKRGVRFREEFKLVDADGRLKAAYLEEEVGGFAVHLLRG